MKKIFSTLFLLCFIVGVSAQENKIENKVDDNLYRAFAERLKNDNRMLHIKLDTRFDFMSTFNNDGVDEMSFKGNTLKLWIVGEITPKIRYRLRHRLNKSQIASREGYGPATDQAFVEFDAGDFTFRAGKQSVQFGTFEYDINPADVYLPSMCFDDLDAYKAGLNIAYKKGGQVLNLQVINSDATQFATDAYRKKALAGLFLWEGSLFKNTLNTRYGYGLFQEDGSNFNHWVTLGTQLKLNKFSAEADWYWGKRNMDMDNVGFTKVEDNSVSLNLTYKMGKFTPQLKGIWDKRKQDNSDLNYERAGVQAGFEFHPFKEGIAKDLRFHALYSYTSTTYNKMGIDNSKKQNMIIIGTRWMFNVW